MLNNIVGLKPKFGLISTAGVVPACRTLDCVSIFSLTVDDAMSALAVMGGPDPGDPFSRDRPLAQLSEFPATLRLGVPHSGQLIFYGDKTSEAAYGAALKRWSMLGATLVGFDIAAALRDCATSLRGALDSRALSGDPGSAGVGA